MKNRLEVVMYDGGGRQVERKVNAINRALSILRLILQDEPFWLWSKPDGEWYRKRYKKAVCENQTRNNNNNLGSRKKIPLHDDGHVNRQTKISPLFYYHCICSQRDILKPCTVLQWSHCLQKKATVEVPHSIFCQLTITYCLVSNGVVYFSRRNKLRQLEYQCVKTTPN